MKIVKLLLIGCMVLSSSTHVQSSQNFSVDVITQLLANQGMQQILAPMFAAIAGGILKQILDISHGENKTLNPLVLEIREATEKYGPSVAAGFQAAGGSIHVKIPNEMSIESARAGFAPFIYLDCVPGSDKALIDRIEADKKPVLSLRTGFGQNCKVEARCNLSNAMWGGVSVMALIIAQIAMAASQPLK